MNYNLLRRLNVQCFSPSPYTNVGWTSFFGMFWSLLCSTLILPLLSTLPTPSHSLHHAHYTEVRKFVPGSSSRFHTLGTPQSLCFVSRSHEFVFKKGKISRIPQNSSGGWRPSLILAFQSSTFLPIFWPLSITYFCAISAMDFYSIQHYHEEGYMLYLAKLTILK